MESPSTSAAIPTRPSLIEQLSALDANHKAFSIDIQQGEGHALEPLAIQGIVEDIRAFLTHVSLRPSNTAGVAIVLASQLLLRLPEANNKIYVILNDIGFAQANTRTDRAVLPTHSEILARFEGYRSRGHIISAPLTRQMSDEECGLAGQGKLPLASNMIRRIELLKLLRAAHGLGSHI